MGKNNPAKNIGQELNSDSLYLDQLEYTPADGKTFLNFFINNFRVTILIVLAIIAWGVVSFTLLPLESSPEVKIPYGVVTVSLPGASPADMEELVVDKIEAKVANLSGVKQVRSSALNSFASITVEFRAEEDLKDALRRLRDAVSNLKAELPSDATEPNVTEISFSNSPVWTVAVTGPYDNFTLHRYAEMVKEELEKLPGANEVTISGGDVYEVSVIYDPGKLQQLGLSVDSVNSVIKATNLALPLGQINISDYKYTLRTDGKFLNTAELRQLPVANLNGQLIYLQDIATVVERAKERDVYSKFSLNGSATENAVTLNVIKKTGSSIITLIDAGKVSIEELKKNKLPADIKLETTLDISKIIRKDFDQLIHDGILTIVMVTIVLFLFVGLKEAFVAGLAVPLVFACSFGMMLLLGLTLNFLSLFSLILSLGLLVDDAIVVVQATKQYLKTGKFTPEEAVLLVFRDFKVLLATTTLTTIWAFIPLVLSTGIIGQYIRSIPLTVSVTLFASFFIAIIINHPMAIILERFRMNRALMKVIIGISGLVAILFAIMTLNGLISTLTGILLTLVTGIIFFGLILAYRGNLRKKLLQNEQLVLEERADPRKIKTKIFHHYLADDQQKSFWVRMIGGLIKVDKILPYYGKILYGIINRKFNSYLVIIVAGLLFAASLLLPATGVLRSEFLPAADSEYLYIDIEGAPGLVTEKTREVASQVEKILLQEKSIKSFSEVIGAAGVNLRGGGMISTGGAQTNRAQFAVNFYPFSERPPSGSDGKVEKSYQIATRLRSLFTEVQGAKVSVTEVAGGPPSGADFEARIAGDDMKELERIANYYKEILASIPGTVNEKISLDLSPGEFTLKMDAEQMMLRGVTAAQVAMTLRTAFSGSEVTKILDNGDETVVRATFAGDQVDTLDKIKTLPLVNARGQSFLLGDVVQISAGSSLTSISRIDQKRVIVLSANVVKPALPAEVLKNFQDALALDPVPAGYTITFGGQNETNAESIFSILRAMLLAMVLIVVTLVVQFNSFRKAIMVLATIPLALTGVFIGLTVMGYTLSFPSLIGIVALFGIVVKNAVILVDKVNLNLKVGIPFIDAIVDAAKSRLEAIFLTSICTIIGMIPITFASETWEGLGASLMFGLLTSTFLTLIIIPVLFSLIMKKSEERNARLAAMKAAAG